MVDNQYLVTWTGMDQSYNEDEKNSLEEARQHAQCLSEHGAHCITISDSDGNEYDF